MAVYILYNKLARILPQLYLSSADRKSVNYYCPIT